MGEIYKSSRSMAQKKKTASKKTSSNKKKTTTKSAKKKTSRSGQTKVAKKKSKKAKTKTKKTSEKIVIDEKNNLVFGSEEELFSHFQPVIEKLEGIFFGKKKEQDIPVEAYPDFEECLPLLLEEPLEIWRDEESIKGESIYNFIGEFEDEEQPDEDPIFYVAQAYMADEVPCFVYLHFPTRNEKLVDEYRKGQVIFDISRANHVEGAATGDALSEGDELAAGLYQAMLVVRGEKDIPEESFPEFFELREESIEEADEIWQSTDSQGNVLVSFIKEFSDIEIEGMDSEELFYIAVTVEEEDSQAHALLFSFPTVDRNLVDRYRQGENLQAEEVTQQSNH